MATSPILWVAFGLLFTAVCESSSACLSRIPDCSPSNCNTVRTESGPVGALLSVCKRCKNSSYAPSVSFRSCDCAKGAYLSGGACVPCPEDHWCPGGSKEGSPAAIPCTANLTTVPNRVAGSERDCATRPGYAYVGGSPPRAILCPEGSYQLGYNNLGCSQCPYGLSTNVSQLATSRSACKAPPGWYRQIHTPQACPKGTYQPVFTLGWSHACLPCPSGVTTPGLAATSATHCSRALPGYSLNGSDAASGAQTGASCPRNYYSMGGTSIDCLECPNGWETRAEGSTSASLCLVPPGKGYDSATSSTVDCVDGYNPGWNRQPCKPCGTGVTSVAPRDSPNSCQISAGQGLLRGSGPTWRAVDCPPATFGVEVDTRGLAFRPCRVCGRGLTSPVKSTNRTACEARPGWYIPVPGGPAALCPVGTWKSSSTNSSSCTACGSGLTTVLTGSVSHASCVAGPGYYIANGAVTMCPIQTWKNTAENSTSCSSCNAPNSYSPPGSDSEADCTDTAPPGYYLDDATQTPCGVYTYKAVYGNSSTLCIECLDNTSVEAATSCPPS